MRLLRRLSSPGSTVLAVALLGSIFGLLAAGCSGGKVDDGTSNPEAKRLTPEEYEAKRAKKGGTER